MRWLYFQNGELMGGGRFLTDFIHTIEKDGSLTMVDCTLLNTITGELITKEDMRKFLAAPSRRSL